jgi:hypothetical protein
MAYVISCGNKLASNITMYVSEKQATGPGLKRFNFENLRH